MLEFREETYAEHGDRAFPDTLTITITSDDPIDSLREAAESAESDDHLPASISLRPDTLRQLLTPGRLELVEAVMDAPPESIRSLARRLDRNYSGVYDDLDLLADHGIIVFAREGRSKRPVVPYDRIEYQGVIGNSDAVPA